MFNIFKLICAIAFLCNSIMASVTLEQMRQSGDVIRNVCQPRFKVADASVLGIREGKFPEDKALKAYVHCVLEMMSIMKKNKITYESAMKQFDVLLPDDYVEPYKTGLTKCKDSTGGVKSAPEAAYNAIKCFYANNPKFTFA